MADVGPPDDALRVFAIDGSTGLPVEPLSAAAVRQRVRRARLRARPPRYGVDMDDLGSAGWGVIFAEATSTNAREALAPLLRRRRRQAGDFYRELTYVPGESTTEFRNRLRAGIGRVDPRQLPWYLLVVGPPAAIPHGFELDLDIPHAVGRLSANDAEDLAAYARRVVDSEERAAAEDAAAVTEMAPPRATIFAPSHPDDNGTAACVEHLARPLARQLAAATALRTVFAEQATRAALLERLGEASELFVFAGHAVSFPPGHAAQRRRQGAVICADWPGPVRWSEGIPPRHTVAAQDLPAAALSGGIAVLFGCHTAGTPRRDLFHSIDPDSAPPLTSEPFAAALPERLLGRHGGALAVAGHVGKAFEASFLWHGVRQTGPLEDTLRALLDGHRLGVALDGFGQRFADLAATWIGGQLRSPSQDEGLLDLWLALHDARSWSLLGDPAVRLATTARRPAATQSRA